MKSSILHALVTATVLWAASLTSHAQSTTFSYQGRLQDGGNPVTGLHDFEFRLFNAASGGAQQGPTVTLNDLGVTNGLFVAPLDFGANFPGADRFLQIAVRPGASTGVYTPLNPRQPITSAPYAIQAANASAAGTVTGGVPAAQITGTLPLAQLPAAVMTNGASGVNISGTFTGNGAGLTGVNLVLNSGGAITWPGNFVLASSPGVGSNPESVTSADVNGDGKPDLISTGANTLTVLTNNGSGGFVLASSPGVGRGSYSVTSADVNGDGKPDLISANAFDDTLTVLTNKGSGHFVLAASPGVAEGPHAVTSADVNSDGKPDLISANAFANTLTVLTNNGSGGFVLAASPGVGSFPRSVTSADVNSDGRPDLISANYSANTLTVLTNDGSGGFVLAASPGVGGGPLSVTSADVNGDGRPDLISANVGANTLAVLTNNGSGGFVLAASPGVGTNPFSVTSADVNGDGKPDLISANSVANTLTALTNNGSGGFVLASSPGVGLVPYAVTAADVNGDGRPDLISANTGDHTLTVLFNTATFSGRFAGNGSGLTSLDAGNLTGTLPLAQLPAAVVTNGASGVNISGTFTGNGAGATNVSLVLNSGGAITWPGNFALASSPGVGGAPYSVTSADVNGDGKPDLVSANYSANTVTVLTNNGSGGFVLASSTGVGSQPTSVTPADVNGDGRTDLISVNSVANTLTVLTNNGSGGFVLAASPSVGGNPNSVTSADVNGDGKPDLISANYSANTLTVLTNTGSGGFGLASSPGVGSGPSSVTSADVNGDGMPDLISANFSFNTLTVLTNNGSGGFVLAASPGVGNNPNSVTSADVNGDGKSDLISANYAANTLTVLTNNGSGGFVLAYSPVVGSGPYSVTSADVNSDGTPDLISANFNVGTLTVLINSAPLFAGSFAGNGSGLIALNAGTLTGAVPPATLTSVPAGNLTGAVPPAALTSVPAGSLTGTIADARLSANVALLNAGQTFGGANNFNASVTLNPPASLSFGSQTRQMINLWSTEYALGVQGSAGYFRSGGDFYWYRGGSHSDANGDAGSGGVPLMSLKSSGRLGLGTTTPDYPLEVQNGLAVGRFTTTNHTFGAVLVLRNSGASPFYLGAINFDDVTGTPGQIGYLASGQMIFRVAGAERMTLSASGLTVNATVTATAFNPSSDRHLKENFDPVNPREVLDKVTALPISRWNFKGDSATPHVGPMAQDFHAAFALGTDERHIATVDADGVALAAIQGLNQKVDSETAGLRSENAELKRELSEIKQLLLKLNDKKNP